VIAALTFGHLPAVFIPAGPMTSGLPNDEKAKVRQLYAEGKVGREEAAGGRGQVLSRPGHLHLLRHRQFQPDADGDHGPALPGASFVNPNTPLRDALTREAAKRALAITALGNEFTPVGRMIDERSIVNGIVGLHATGGSTNHTMHLIAMARAAGIRMTWQDISELSDVPCRCCPRLSERLADVNHFHAAGGMGFLIRELLDAGCCTRTSRPCWGEGLRPYTVEPSLPRRTERSGVRGSPAEP
jgi:phosphogluconate dehydratase